MNNNEVVYLKYPLAKSLVDCLQFIGCPFLHKYIKNEDSIVSNGEDGPDGYTCITTNYTTILENNWMDDLKYKCVKTEYHK